MPNKRVDRDWFALVEVEIEEVVFVNVMQVQIMLAEQQRKIWIPKSVIQDDIGGQRIEVGENLKQGQMYITIKVPYHYAKARGIVK